MERWNYKHIWQTHNSNILDSTSKCKEKHAGFQEHSYQHEPPQWFNASASSEKNLPAGEGLMISPKHYTTFHFQRTCCRVQSGLSGCSVIESVKLKFWIVFAWGLHVERSLGCVAVCIRTVGVCGESQTVCDVWKWCKHSIRCVKLILCKLWWRHAKPAGYHNENYRFLCTNRITEMYTL